MTRIPLGHFRLPYGSDSWKMGWNGIAEESEARRAGKEILMEGKRKKRSIEQRCVLGRGQSMKRNELTKSYFHNFQNCILMLTPSRKALRTGPTNRAMERLIHQETDLHAFQKTFLAYLTRASLPTIGRTDGDTLLYRFEYASEYYRHEARRT